MRWWVRKNEFILQLCKFRFCISQLLFFGLKHIFEDELYMSEGTKNLASIIHDKWSMNERRICHLLQASPCKLNQSQIRRGDRMMQSSLWCRSNSSLTQVFQNNSSWKTELKNVSGHLKLKGLCNSHDAAHEILYSRLSPSVSKLCQSCRVPLKVVVKLSFCSFDICFSTRNNAEFYNERKLFETMLLRTLFKAYEKICLWRGGFSRSLFANI